MFNHLMRLLVATTLLCHVHLASATPTSQNAVKIQGMLEIPSLDPTRSGYPFNRMQILETLLNVDHSGQLTPDLTRLPLKRSAHC